MIARDVEYSLDGTLMRGLLLAPDSAELLPTVVLIHDAFGLGGFSLDEAHRYADLGYAVFAADVWGERMQVHDEREIGPLIAAMVRDRETWRGRIAAAHDAARRQPEVDPARVVTIGYCFGGSSALEYARIGGDVRGVVAVHPGLDLLEPGADWTPVDDLRVLLCVGADDPMATGAQRDDLLTAMDEASVHWQLDLYSGTTHAFTNPRLTDSPHPDIAAYQPSSAHSARLSTLRLLDQTLKIIATEPAGQVADYDKEER
jgi:dienelactone hydrolase